MTKYRKYKKKYIFKQQSFGHCLTSLSLCDVPIMAIYYNNINHYEPL